MVASSSSSLVCSLRSACVRCRFTEVLALRAGLTAGTFGRDFTCRPDCFSEIPRPQGDHVAVTQRSSWDSEDLDAFRDLAHTFCQKELAPNHERWSAAK